MPRLTVQPVDWIHTAPFRARATRELPASRDAVFAALADHETWPEWFDAIQRVERFGDLHEGVGSRRRIFLKARISIEEEFNVWEPGRRWGFVVSAATLPGLRSMSELVTLEEAGEDRTSVTYTMGIDAKFPLSKVLPFGREPIGENLGDALDALGRRLEGAS